MARVETLQDPRCCGKTVSELNLKGNLSWDAPQQQTIEERSLFVGRPESRSCERSCCHPHICILELAPAVGSYDRAFLGCTVTVRMRVDGRARGEKNKREPVETDLLFPPPTLAT